MKRQCGRWLREAIANFTSRQSLRALLDEQPEDIEAGFLG
jgi:hypothetical protein